jgi:hypothetical protein
MSTAVKYQQKKRRQKQQRQFQQLGPSNANGRNNIGHSRVDRNSRGNMQEH